MVDGSEDGDDFDLSSCHKENRRALVTKFFFFFFPNIFWIKTKLQPFPELPEGKLDRIFAHANIRTNCAKMALHTY